MWTNKQKTKDNKKQKQMERQKLCIFTIAVVYFDLRLGAAHSKC